MKRFFIPTCVFGAAVFLSTACKKEQALPPQPQPQHIVIARKQIPDIVRAEPPPRSEPAKPAEVPPREIAPGTTAYLDSRSSFRDVTLGEQESSIGNLVLKSHDEARQIKTFTRSGDELSLDGMPLESIEYSFFQGRLLEIQLKWNLDYKDVPAGLSPPSDVSVRCTSFYGPPTQSDVSRSSSQLVWRGRQAELIITELRLAGVLNRVNGGWSVPPRTSGRMVIRSVPLSRAAKAADVAQTFDKENGF